MAWTVGGVGTPWFVDSVVTTRADFFGRTHLSVDALWPTHLLTNVEAPWQGKGRIEIEARVVSAESVRADGLLNVDGDPEFGKPYLRVCVIDDGPEIPQGAICVVWTLRAKRRLRKVCRRSGARFEVLLPTA